MIWQKAAQFDSVHNCLDTFFNVVRLEFFTDFGRCLTDLVFFKKISCYFEHLASYLTARFLHHFLYTIFAALSRLTFWRHLADKVRQIKVPVGQMNRFKRPQWNISSGTSTVEHFEKFARLNTLRGIPAIGSTLEALWRHIGRTSEMPVERPVQRSNAWNEKENKLLNKQISIHQKSNKTDKLFKLFTKLIHDKP